MKKYKNILIVTVALLLCGILAISSSAILRKIDLEDYSHRNAYHNDQAEKYLTEVDFFKNKVDLIYIDSQTNPFNGDVLDYYVDEAENEYIYKPNGSLNSISFSEKTSTKLRQQVCEKTYGKNVVLNKKQAIEYGTAILQKMRETDFDKFEYTQYTDYNNIYNIIFEQKLQKDYVGECAIVRFDAKGNLRVIAYKANGDLTNFNPAILNAVSDKMTDAYIVEQLKEKYFDRTYVDHEIEKKYIRKIDGKYGILFEVKSYFTSEDKSKNFTTSPEVFYPFPDQTAIKK